MVLLQMVLFNEWSENMNSLTFLTRDEFCLEITRDRADMLLSREMEGCHWPRVKTRGYAHMPL